MAQSPDRVYWEGRSDLIRPPAPPPAVELTLPRVDRWKLKNGLDVVAVPRRGLPIVSFSIAIKAGGYDEQKNRTQGVADFVAAMLRKGTRKRGAEAIADAVDGVGGGLDAAAAMEHSTATCSVLAKDAALCLDLLAEMLLTPTFPEGEMAEIRDQILASLAARTDDPHQLAAEHFDNLFFGEGHPDGWVLSDEHVRAITRDTLVAFWKDYYRPNNAMLAVAGDFDVGTIKAQIGRAFGSWRSAPIPIRPDVQIPRVKGTRVVLVDKPDLTQATLMFGHRGIRHGDSDWYATTLVNYVLGGSDFSSRLMTEVRSKRGLTYGIGSSFGATLYEGAFRISAATRNETAWDALSVTVDEVRKMKNLGPSADELAKAKGYYAGSVPFELESAAGIARGIVAAELHGLGIAYVRRLPLRLAGVDEGAARAAAQSHLDPDDMVIVVVGRASIIEAHLRESSGGLIPAITVERIDYRAPISAAKRRASARTGTLAPASP
jgi:zinc protease